MFQGSNARMFLASSVTMFHDKFPERNAQTFPDNSVTMFPGNNVQMYLGNSVVTCLNRNVRTNPDSSVGMYRDSSASRCPSRSVMPANPHTGGNRGRYCRKYRLSHSYRSVTECKTTNTLSGYVLETLIVLILFIYLCQYYLWHSSQTDGIKYK